MQRRIDNAHERGVTTEVVKTEEDFEAFSKLLRKHHIFKPKRYIPDDAFFRSFMAEKESGRLFVTKYHGKVIGCSAVAYSQGDAYLWYSAFRRKTYHHLHPDIITIWDAMKDAHERGFRHMCFMDVGLPFEKNSFREFILRFGGKEQSTYRWFRFTLKWVNKLLAWIYRE
jgi:lipid II:glycine glycyltransferase (peptidoglycan interpeptide bridge formation enzyme)